VADEVEPIADDELLYRRVPASTGWFDPVTRILKPEAFGPNKTRDVTGISVTRAKFKSIEQAAQGQPGKSYFVAVLCVGDLRKTNFTVKPQPNVPGGYDISHAELPDLNASNYKSTETLERQRDLAERLCLRVEGPFKAEETASQ
jgi:hypothetical protein